MKKAKIYTRTGDKGETGLVGGQRLSKADTRIGLYGELDELNSYIGMALSFKTENTPIQCIDQLIEIQNRVFDLGSTMACIEEERDKFKLNRISKIDIEKLEAYIDEMSKDLPELRNFILPGGTQMGSILHVCRTVTRRIERSTISYKNISPEEIKDFDIMFLNRLSDYLFTVSRFINYKENFKEVGWNVK